MLKYKDSSTRRSLTLNALPLSLGILLYTDSYLESVVFFLSYVAVYRLWNSQISGQGSDLVMVDVFHHLVQQPFIHFALSAVLRLLTSSRHYCLSSVFRQAIQNTVSNAKISFNNFVSKSSVELH